MKSLGNHKNIKTDPDNIEYYEIVADLLEHEAVQSMENYNHHFGTTCLKHSVSVSYYCYVMSKKLGLDYRSAARGGLLHDLFLYDWKTHKVKTGEALHGFTHPHAAYHNAKQYFELNQIEEDMILKHMWPLTLLQLPRYKETFVIVMVDKICSVLEIGAHFMPMSKFAEY